MCKRNSPDKNNIKKQDGVFNFKRNSPDKYEASMGCGGEETPQLKMKPAQDV